MRRCKVTIEQKKDFLNNRSILADAAFGDDDKQSLSNLIKLYRKQFNYSSYTIDSDLMMPLRRIWRGY